MLHILKTYQNKLANLTSQNRTLGLFKLSGETCIDFSAFNFAHGLADFKLLEMALSLAPKITLCPVTNPRDKENNALSNSLLKLYRKQKMALEEKGTHDMYVGYPILRGKFINGTSIAGPLLLFPYNIEIQEHTKKQWVLALRGDADMMVNKSFVLAYSHYQQQNIDETYWDNLFETQNIDSLSFRNRLYEFLKHSGFEINFNRELFVNKLHPFTTFVKEDFDSTFANGELKLFPEAVLGLFPEAGSTMYADYQNIMRDCKYKNLEEFFISKTATTNATVKEEHIKNPFPIDGAQRNAISEIKKGKSIVVQGPPGSGKSQLIANLACDYMAQGKNVLIVCQKYVALEVILQRLKSKELQQFCALVHDANSDRKTLFQQIATQINHVEQYENNAKTLDAIVMEREYLQLCRLIDNICEELENYKKILFDTSKYGISIHELYKKKINKNSIIIESKISNLNYFEIVEKTKIFNYIWTLEKKNNHIDKFKNIHKSLNKNELIFLTILLKSIYDTHKKINESPSKNHEQIVMIYSKICELKALQSYTNFIKKGIEMTHHIQVAETLAVEIPSHIYTLKNIDNHINKLNAVIPLLGNNLKNKILFYFNKNGKYLRKYYKNIYKKLNIDILKSEVNHIENHRLCIEICKKILPESIDVCTKDYMIKSIKKLKNENKKFNNIIEIISNNYQINIEKIDIEFIENTEKIIKKYLDDYNEIIKNFSTKTIEEILNNNKELFQNFIDFIKEKSDLILEFQNIYRSLSQNEQHSYEELSNAYKIDFDIDFYTFCLHSYLKTIIAEVEEKHPELTMTGTGRMNYLINSLQSNIEAKQQLVTAMLKLYIAKQTFKNLQYNRLQNRTTYRELLHQTTKKKKIWKPRKLIENFASELFSLIPCWMASPESVSMLFPCRTVFDLVIFDEASQCFVEKAFPAMWRAKQIVVVGDSKQLQPFDLYSPRWESAEAESPDTDMPSALDLCSMYLPSTMLTGHYRSKHPALIAFSNKEFYSDKLIQIPDKQTIEKEECPIQYIKTEGVWQQHQNLAEAQKVVETAIHHHMMHPTKEIGIVTFNLPQMILIENLLFQNGGYNLQNIVVKNIENVQGDEKDIIIFSIGYAPGADGVLRHHFGTLNLPGGENRLNVAITRAREKIIIVASIFPHQLQVNDTLNDGPKLLKAYLQYAYDLDQKNSQEHEKSYPKVLQNGYVRTTHAFADLIFYQNGIPQKAVFEDGQKYYENPYAIDYFGYKPLAMKHKNWEVEYTWSREVEKNTGFTP